MTEKETENIETPEEFWEQVNRVNEKILFAQSGHEDVQGLWDQKYRLVLLGLEKNWIDRIPKDDIWDF